MKEVLAAPDRWTYSDLAIAPPRADEFETLDLYRATSGGEAALARKRRDEAIRAGAEAAHREHAGAGALWRTSNGAGRCGCIGGSGCCIR